MFSLHIILYSTLKMYKSGLYTTGSIEGNKMGLVLPRRQLNDNGEKTGSYQEDRNGSCLCCLLWV